MTETPYLFKPGDRVRHKSRDSHSWTGTLIQLLEASDAESVALVDVDDKWARWRLVPLRTLEKAPVNCDSAYAIAKEDKGWCSPIRVVSCDRDAGHTGATAGVHGHHGKVGPVGDQADIYW